MASDKDTKGRERFEKLCEVLRGKSGLLIVLQDFPDPDAIAAAAALKEIVRVMVSIPVSMACSGVIGRSENRELVRYMDLNLLRLPELDIGQYESIAMLDTQPGTGNNALPKKILPDVVIDHHPIGKNTRKCLFHDIRKHYGATSTILYEYLKTAGIPASTQLATALVYGIKSDTDDLGREISPADVAAFVDLYPSVNHRIMGRIKTASLPAEYFVMLHQALDVARKYGSCVVAGMGEIRNPDMIGEVADLFLRPEGCEWALCYGSYQGRILLSLRTTVGAHNAGQTMRKIVWQKGTGGGHGAMAGGQLPIADCSPEEVNHLQELITRRFLKQTGNEEEAGIKLFD